MYKSIFCSIEIEMSMFDTHQEETDEEENTAAGETQDSSDDIAFIAKLRSSRTLASILKTIHFADVILVIFVRILTFLFLFSRTPFFVLYQQESKSLLKISNVSKAMLSSIHVFSILMN